MPCRSLPLLVVISLCLLSGCGGGSGSTPFQSGGVKVSVSPKSTTVAAGGTVAFFASVTGANNTAVTWEVNGTAGGDATVGTITSSGAYTAPTLIPSPAVVTVKAVSQADASKSGSASATIALGLSPAAVTMNISDPVCSSTQAFTATGSNGGYNFLVNGIPSGDSTFGVISGSGLYTAPGAIPLNPLFSVSAISATDSTQVGTASVMLQAGGPDVNEAFLPTPIQLGTSGGNVNDSSSGFCCSGTLGALVTRNGTNFILSNNHVLARSGKAIVGEQISQPGLVDTRCGTQANTVVANFTQAVKLNAGGTSIADAAIAQVANGQVDPTGAILGLGTVSCGIAQPAPPASTTAVASPGMLVAKSGRTTGLTCGQIDVVNLLVTVTYENACGSNATFDVNYDQQIDILSNTFSAPGDSGSLIVDSQTSEPVGLLYAGSDSDTVANPIQDVLGALGDTANPPHFPTFVGGPQHPVQACTGTGASNASSQAFRAPTVLHLAETEIARASTAKTAHAASLMKIPGVLGVGVGSGSQSGKAALVIFVEKGKTPGAIPAQVDGVPTRVRVVKRFKALAGACPAEASTSTKLQSLR